MIRGTTPTLTFNLPFETSFIKQAYVTIKGDDDEIKVDKPLCDCSVTEKSIAFKLTQEETLSLPPCTLIKIQLRVLTQGGDSLVSEVFKRYVSDVLKEGVIE